MSSPHVLHVASPAPRREQGATQYPAGSGGPPARAAQPLRAPAVEDRTLHTDDAALARRALAGDEAAVTLLLGRCYRDVWKMSYDFLKDRHEAEDAAQETMEKAWRKLALYEATGSFRSWVLSICKRTCQDHMRTLAKASLEPLGDQEPPEQGVEVALVDRITVQHALAELRAADRLAWLLVDYLGYRSHEAAAVIGDGSAASTIRTRVDRVHRHLERALGAGAPPSARDPTAWIIWTASRDSPAAVNFTARGVISSMCRRSPDPASRRM